MLGKFDGDKVVAADFKISAHTNRVAVLEGHTDQRRYANGTRYGNWELSADRANAAPELRQYALYGITTAVSQGTDDGDVLVRIKRAQQGGDLRGARVMTTLFRFGFDRKPITPAEARAKVDEIANQGADVVKIWCDSLYGTRAKIAPEVRAAILEQARKHGRVTTAHIYELADAKMMIEAGLNVLAHNVRDREVDAGLISSIEYMRIPNARVEMIDVHPTVMTLLGLQSGQPVDGQAVAEVLEAVVVK